MKVELHITEVEPAQVATGTDWPTPTVSEFYPGSPVLAPIPERIPTATVVQLATDHDMSAYDIAALLRSVANSLSPRNPQENP